MRVYSLQGQDNKAIAEGEKALAISPNFAELNLTFGETLSTVGRHEEALERVKRGLRLNPHQPPIYFHIAGICYSQAGMIEEAIESFEREIELNPNAILLRSWMTLASLYAQLGRDEDAKKAAIEVHRIAPDYSWGKYGRGAPKFNDKDIERRFFDSLRKVGLK